MTLSEPLAVTFTVIDVLDALGIPYLLGGSFASSAQGAARATLDADLVADLRPEHVAPFVAALRDAFYLDPDTVRSAVLNRGSFSRWMSLSIKGAHLIGHSLSAVGLLSSPSIRRALHTFPARRIRCSQSWYGTAWAMRYRTASGAIS